MCVVRFSLLILGFGIIALACGCNAPLRYEKTEEILPAESRTYTISGPKKDQKVKIEASADEPISVVVKLEEKADEMESLAKEFDKKQIEIEVNIPAGKSFVVIVTVKKKCTVTTKVNSI